MVSCFLDSRLDIDIPIKETNIHIKKYLGLLLEEQLGATLVSDIDKISECCLSIVRLDDSSEPLRRCAILYHSISNKTLCIIGFLKDKKSLPKQNHIYAMGKLICLDNEEELKTILVSATRLIREGKDDEYITDTLKRIIEKKKSGLLSIFYKSLKSTKNVTI